MTLDAQLVTAYRAAGAEHNAHGAYGLRIARATLANNATRARFASVGAICYADGYTIGNNPKRAYLDYGNDDPIVRLVIIPDYDGTEDALEFDCCPDPSTGSPDTGARWVKCGCVINGRRGIDASDVYDADSNAYACEYGQPCGHKCEEARRIDRDGVVGIVAQARDSAGEWHETDACWGFVGGDWRDGDADIRFMESALDASADILRTEREYPA